MTQRIEAGRATIYCALVLAMFYTIFVCAAGIPALRHDWWWPIERYGFIDLFVHSTSGWSENGIGAPYAYPGSYIVGTLVAGVGLLLGPYTTLILYTFAIALICTLRARALALVLNATPMRVACIEIFALFNPWVYSKTVAGHLYMVLAYAAMFAIVAELVRPKVRPLVLAALVILTLAQLQFFVIAMAALTVHAAFRRTYLPWISGVIIGLPIWIGIALDRPSLLHIPYTLAWERSQSIDPWQAFILRGYFTTYAQNFSDFQVGALCFIVAIAFFAATSTRRRVLAFVTAALVAIFLVFATGTRGPLGDSYAAIVTSLPESGLFRELYDLLGFVAIGYCLLLALAPERRVLNASLLAAACIVWSGWLFWPPARYWVDSARIPVVHFTAPRNTRFALFPPFQPLRFDDRGSGADRDTYRRPGNVNALNEYVPQYPVDAALAGAWQDRKFSALRALSVSTVVERPWLSLDASSLAAQINGTPSGAAARGFQLLHLEPLPEVTLDDLPAIGSLVNAMGSGNALFTDASPLGVSSPRFIEVNASKIFVDESKGWVDVHFDFLAHPDLAQGIGGAVTTNPTAELSVREGLAALVNVSGTLYAQGGRVLAGSTHGYRWLRLREDVRSVHCTGRCVVAAQAALVTIPPLNPPARRYRSVSFQVLQPWLVRVAVPSDAPPVLRYNVAFDSNWTAFANGTTLPHFRIDTAVNGWLLPKTAAPSVVYLFHRAALLQAAAEIIGLVWVLVLVYLLRKRSNSNTRS